MNRADVPDAEFIDPYWANLEAVRDLIGDMLTQLLGQLEAADSRPPLPEDSTAPLATIPAAARAQHERLDDLETVVAESMNPALIIRSMENTHAFRRGTNPITHSTVHRR